MQTGNSCWLPMVSLSSVRPFWCKEFYTNAFNAFRVWNYFETFQRILIMVFFLIWMMLNLQISPVRDLNFPYVLGITCTLNVEYQHCTIFLQSFLKWNLKNHISLFLSDRLLRNMKDQGQMTYEERLLNHSDGCPLF